MVVVAHNIVVGFQGITRPFSIFNSGAKTMRRWYLFMVFVVFPTMILAQTGDSRYEGPDYASRPYQPAVPAPSTTIADGGYGGYDGASTAAGSAMNGMASVISAKGSANLSNSAAVINMTEAQKNAIQNQQLGAETYFQMQRMNQAYKKEQRSPPPTKEQMARWARDAAPKPVAYNEVNPATGKVSWPDVLLQDSFAPQHSNLDQLLAKKATYGSLSFSDQMEARKTIEAMHSVLRSQIKNIPPQQYMDSYNFLRSLVYATSKSDL
jgi:hypothetical protein